MFAEGNSTSWAIGLIGGRKNPLLCSEIERLLGRDGRDLFGSTRVQRLDDPEPLKLLASLESLQPDLLLIFVPPCINELRPLMAALQEETRTCPVVAVFAENPPIPLPDIFKGVSDFVVPPLRTADILLRVQLHLPPKENAVSPALVPAKHSPGLGKILGRSVSLMVELEKLERLSNCSATVIITGETGSGKELFARAIHKSSPRAEGPFVPVNCGAIPESLLENEFFGHARGAFTGATDEKPGLINESDGGSLFLDEIDALPVLMQVKLLRFLQEKEYRPLGSTRTVRSDVRVIVASNTSLDDAVRAGRFRPDLYYRLKVLSFHLPPLRQRREDILILAEHFLQRYATEHQRAVQRLTTQAQEKLLSYDWPGNIRELENVIQRGVLVAAGNMLDASALDLPQGTAQEGDESFRARKARAIKEFELTYLTGLLHKYDGNITAAARGAQKNRRAFWELLRKHRLHLRRHS